MRDEVIGTLRVKRFLRLILLVCAPLVSVRAEGVFTTGATSTRVEIVIPKDLESLIVEELGKSHRELQKVHLPAAPDYIVRIAGIDYWGHMGGAWLYRDNQGRWTWVSSEKIAAFDRKLGGNERAFRKDGQLKEHVPVWLESSFGRASKSKPSPSK